MNSVIFQRIARFCIVIITFALALYTLFFVSKVTYPFIIGLAIAFLINPIVNLLERKAHFPRSLAVIVSLVVLIGIFVGMITLLIAEIVSGAAYFAEALPRHVNTIVTYIENFIAGQIIPLYEQAAYFFKSLETGQQETILDNIQATGQSIASTAGDFLQN
ncbi:MAG TPA: AI-2E family transporter, partial [Chondromyces sp.]|nr:AI-2E family transporter [Chondromyces sp.]